MSGVRQFLVCSLVLLASLAIANADCTPVFTAESGWKIQFVNVTYDATQQITVFTYTVTTGSNDLSHVVVSPVGCDNSHPAPALVDDFNWEDLTASADHFGKSGYRSAFGQAANTVSTLQLALHGDVHFVNNAQAILEGFLPSIGQAATTAQVAGPACAGGFSAKVESICGTAPFNVDSADCANAPLGAPASLPSGWNFGGDVITPGRCDGDYTLAKTYYTVAQGSSFTSCTQTVHVTDQHPPVVSFPNGDSAYIVLNCTSAEPALPQVSVSDNCDNAPVLNYCNETSRGACPNNYFVVRSWTATDKCGLSTCKTQTIVYVDHDAPKFTSHPNDVTLECSAITRPGNIADILAAHAQTPTTDDDNGCGAAGISGPHLSTKTRPGDCGPDTFDLINTWTISDECGNTNAVSQKITVTDTRVPELKFDADYHPGGTYECDKVPAPPAVYYRDDCVTGGLWLPLPAGNFKETRHNGSCPDDYFLFREWSFTDNCGNCAKLNETITVLDLTPPVWNLPLPASKSVQCFEVPAREYPTATDNCGTITYDYSETRHNTSCENEYVLVRTYTATDACSNSAVHNQTLTVFDNTPTKIDASKLPSTLNYQCAAEVPTATSQLGSVIALPCDIAGCENCDWSATPSASDVNSTKPCTNKFNITRTYTLTDCTGNTDSVPVLIQVADTQSPVIDDSSLTILRNTPFFECSNLPQIPNLPVTDNCNTLSPITPTSNTESLGCEFNYRTTYTWSVEDDCHNPASVSVPVRINDTTAPDFDFIPPATVNLQCEDALPMDNLTATDNCAAVSKVVVNNFIPWQFTYPRASEGCYNDYTILKTWTATDSCGNVKTVHQNIIVKDDTAPTLSGVPADVTVDCSNIPVPPAVCASDNCNGVTVTYNQERVDDNSCANHVFYRLKRTWTACDQCGRCTSQTQVISVEDTHAPTTPNQINLSGPCDDQSWWPQAPVWTDDCNTFTTDSHTQRFNGDCNNNYILQRTYTATDMCGNVATLVYNLTVYDNKNPSFSSFPNDESAYCTLPPAPTVAGTDTCSTYTITGPVDVTSNQQCDHNFTVSRTWTITDQCSNTFARTQVVNVYDDKAPVLNPVSPVTLECIADLVLTHPGATDCSNNLTPGFVDINYSSPCPNRVSFTRVWNSTDDCGNTGFASQPVTVNDQSAPTISGDFPTTVSDFCTAPAPPSVCAQDNCAGVWINFTETRTEHASTPGCSYTLLRSWWATDVCGQTSPTITQTVTINDNQKPTFVWPTQPPANNSVTSVTCSAPAKIVPTARDNCGLEVTVTDNSHKDGSDCPYDYTQVYSFTITDHCGNTDTYTWSYKVTSLDLQITWPNGVPQSTTQTCSVIPPWEMPSVKDGCNGADFTVQNFTDLSETNGCSDIYKINRRWEITDSCGHHHTFVQNLTGTHTVPPTWTFVPSDVSSSQTHCGETVTPHSPYGRDMCNRVITISTEGAFPDTTVKDADCPSFDRTDLYKWVGTDVCGLQIRTQAEVDYCDCQPPTVIAPNDRSFSDVCTRAAPLAPSVNDNCQLASTSWTVVNNTQMTCPWIGTVTFTYTAYDLCGATSTDVAVDTYVQTAEGLPYFTVTPLDVTLNCDDLLPTDEAKAVDRCGTNIPLTKTVSTHHDCDNIYQINKTWTGTDVCGNPISHTQHIRVLDPYGPTLINKPPPALTVQCGLVPEPANVLATSVCPGVNVTLATTYVNGSNCCNYTIFRTWTATTQCGLQDTFTQVITVVNTLPIPLPPIPPNQDQDCDNGTFITFPVEFKYPPLAEGLCVDTFANADQCTATTSPHFVYDDFVVAVPASGQYRTAVNHLVLEYSAVVPIIADGVAQLQLVVKNPAGQVEDWHLTLQGFTAFSALGTYQPEQLLAAGCYSGSQGVDVSGWYYYASVNGSYSGASGDVSVTPGKYAQYGVGAAGFNKEQGITIFVRYTSASDGSVVDRVLHVPLKLEGSNTQAGPCVFDHTSFPNLESQGTQLETHYRNWTNYTYGESCRYDYTFHEEWCSCDCSTGGRVCAERTIRVHDDYNPTIHIIAPAGQNGTEYEYTTACAEVVPPTVTTDHPCHTNINLEYETVVTRNVTVTRPDGALLVCDGLYTVTVTATDECSKVSTAQYSVTQYDHTAPELNLTPPTQPFYECAVPEPVPATSSDSCGVATPNGYSVHEDKTAGSCPYDFSVKYTYSVEDWCGLSTTKSYTVKAKDITLPTYELTNYPADGTLECRSSYTPNVVGQDNCDANPTVAVPIINTQFANATCTSFLNTTTYRISVTDVCGLTNTTTFAVTYVDTINPEFDQTSLPASATVSCDAVPPPAVVRATDACDLMYIKFEEKHTDNDGDNCANSYVITRTWTAYDCAGNTAVYVQTITVEDHTAPVLDATPANVVDTDGTLCVNVPPPASRCASDNCASLALDYAQTITWDQADNTACKRYTLNRTYTATDDCDNSVSDWYTVRVYDNAPPTWDTPAETPPEELACDNPNGFIPTEPTATDICSGVKYYKDQFSSPDGCAFNYTRHWQFEAYDNCLQPVWRNYSVRIRDVYQPVISGQPADQTLECKAALPGRVAVMTHKCFNDITANLQYEDVSSNFNANCAGMHTVTRTYYGQDDCGLKADNVTVVFTFNDSINPFWTSNLPGDVTVQCDAVPPADVLTAADDCTPVVPVIYNQEQTPSGDCNNKYTITRTWTATDCNGNFIKHVQTIHVIDTTAPQLDATPANVHNASCNAVPMPADRCVTDNCDGVNVVYNQSRNDYQGPACNQYYLNRTYTATDNCGNTVSDWYTVGVWDSVAPVFVPASPDANGQPANSFTCEVEATTDAPAPTSYSDDCNANSDVTYGQAQPFPAVTVSATCEFNKTKVYTYTAADACGNTATWSKTYTFYDTTAPVFITTPAPRSFYCQYGAAPVPPTANDNCAINANVNVVQSLYVNPGLTQTGDDCPSYTVQWGWYAEDTCGNKVYTYVNDTVYDNEAPQWDEVPPATLTFNCSDDIQMPVLTAHDCTNVNITTKDSGPIYDISSSCQNTYHIIWEWWATDACGNVNYTKTTVTVVDQIKPVISDVPAGQEVVTVECTSIPAPPSMCCNDNCLGVDLSHQQNHVNSTTCSSVYNLTRAWTCVDACGNNAAPQNQLVVVQDTKAPVFESAAYTLQDYQLECYIDAQVDYTATDACTGAHVDKHEDVNAGHCSHNYTVLRFWTATDDCGNSVVVNQTVTVADTISPTISAIPGLCLYQPDYYPYIRLGDFTRNGTVFTFDDTCSSVAVIPRSCVSSQSNPSDSGTHGAGFSDDCYYDAATDSMVIHSVIYNFPAEHSRNFTIYVVARDECGHETPSEFSLQLSLGDECGPRTFCALSCPLPVGPVFNTPNYTTTVDGFSQYNPTADTTTFSYNVTWWADVEKQSFVVGADFSQFVLVSANPDNNWKLGPTPGALVNGISWTLPSSSVSGFVSSTFSFTVKGLVQVGQVPVQVGDVLSSGESEYDLVTVATGPVLAALFTGLNTIAGSVAVDHVALQSGSASTPFSFPVAYAAVALYLPGQAPVAYTLTDVNGVFRFNGYAAGVYKVSLLQEGSLSTSTLVNSQPANWLSNSQRNGDNFPRFSPDAATSPLSPVAFHLTVSTNPLLHPYYAVTQPSLGAPHFFGNARNVEWWKQQFLRTRYYGNVLPATATFASYNWNRDFLGGQLTARTDSYIQARCPAALWTASSLLSSATSYDQALGAALLNHLSGKGFFEPYDVLQTIFLEYAIAVKCTGVAPATDNFVQAETFLGYINAANGMPSTAGASCSSTDPYQ